MQHLVRGTGRKLTPWVVLALRGRRVGINVDTSQCQAYSVYKVV